MSGAGEPAWRRFVQVCQVPELIYSRKGKNNNRLELPCLSDVVVEWGLEIRTIYSHRIGALYVISGRPRGWHVGQPGQPVGDVDVRVVIRRHFPELADIDAS